MAVPAGFFALIATRHRRVSDSPNPALSSCPRSWASLFRPPEAGFSSPACTCGLIVEPHRRRSRTTGSSSRTTGRFDPAGGSVLVGDVRTVRTRINARARRAAPPRYDHHENKALLSNGHDISLASDIRDAGIVASRFAQLLRKHLRMGCRGWRTAGCTSRQHRSLDARPGQSGGPRESGARRQGHQSRHHCAGRTADARFPLGRRRLMECFSMDRKPARRADSEAVRSNLQNDSLSTQIAPCSARSSSPGRPMQSHRHWRMERTSTRTTNSARHRCSWRRRRSSQEVIDALLRAAGANINFSVQVGNDLQGRTPLMNAATSGQRAKSAALLLNSGAGCERLRKPRMERRPLRRSSGQRRSAEGAASARDRPRPAQPRQSRRNPADDRRVLRPAGGDSRAHRVGCRPAREGPPG